MSLFPHLPSSYQCFSFGDEFGNSVNEKFMILKGIFFKIKYKILFLVPRQ